MQDHRPHINVQRARAVKADKDSVGDMNVLLYAVMLRKSASKEMQIVVEGAAEQRVHEHKIWYLP